MSRRWEPKEVWWALGVLALGVGVRAAFVWIFPTRALIDAYELAQFGKGFVDLSAFDHSERTLWLWTHWNPATPLYLSLWYRLLSAGTDEFLLAASARWAMALTTGTLPLIAFLVLKDVFPRWVRVLIAMLLAVWPGQVAFSGVVLQDNLVIPPTVALACLGLRAAYLGSAHPGWAATLLALSVAIRQETLITNLPLAFLAAGALSRPRPDWRSWGRAAAVLLLGLATLAGLRYSATGRFSIGTGHGGVSVLGAYAPGAGTTGYIDYGPFAAALGPRYADGLGGREELHNDAFRLVREEFLRRPIFHLIRIAGTVAYHLEHQEDGGDWWAFGSDPGSPTGAVLDERIAWAGLDPTRVLPADRYRIAAAILRRADVLRKGYLVVLHGLFVAAFILATLKRWWPVTVVGLGYVFRLVFHGFTVMQPRFLLVGTALELLVIITTAMLVLRQRLQACPRERQLLALALAPAIAIAILAVAANRPVFSAAATYVETHDNLQRSYRFAILITTTTPGSDGGWFAGRLRCAVDEGAVVGLNESAVTLRLLNPDPKPGERTIAHCTLSPTADGAYFLKLRDSYGHGGFPNKVILQVREGESLLLRHDLAETPFTGDLVVPMGVMAPGEQRTITVELLAFETDPGPRWGGATPVALSAYGVRAPLNSSSE
jgi:hypothetical protein